MRQRQNKGGTLPFYKLTMGREQPGLGRAPAPQWPDHPWTPVPMRKISLLIALTAALALTGCHWWPGQKAERVVVRCNCTGAQHRTARGRIVRRVRPAHTLTRHRYRRVARLHHRSMRSQYHSARHQRANSRAGSRRYIWHKRQAEAAVDAYGYSSSSHVSHSAMQASGDTMMQSRAAHARHGAMPAHYGGQTRVWADGYGRRHIYDQSAVRHYAYEAHMRKKQGPARRDPWHGYDDDWN
jgi:hypothetical protein